MLFLGSEDPEVHATNHSSEATTDGFDNRTSGRLVGKTKRVRNGQLIQYNLIKRR